MSKPFLTYEQQIDLLKSKNLIVADEEYAKITLSQIGYFSLIGGYKHPFIQTIVSRSSTTVIASTMKRKC